MRYPTERAVLEDLFGTANATALIELPTQVDAFIKRLPPGHVYTSSAIIRDHTTFPYYRCFVPTERALRAEAVMRGQQRGHVPQILGLGPTTVPAPAYLRYCEDCFAADDRAHNTPYWRRVHQLPGVFLCPLHGSPVRRSRYERTSRQSRRAFHPLDAHALLGNGGDPLAFQDSLFEEFLHIAQESQWLLSWHGTAPDHEALRQRYQAQIQAAGFASSRGYVWIRQLRSALAAHFTNAFLASVGCQVLSRRGGDDWLGRIVRSPTSTSHPLQHILLARLLGTSVRQILADEPATAARTAPPPMEDPAAPAPPLRARGQRLGMPSPEWEARLKEMVEDQQYTLDEMAKELGVVRLTLQRHAKRLGVWRPEWRMRSRKIPSLSRAQQRERRRKTYRDVWLALRKKHPGLGRSELGRFHSQAYQWLVRNDAEWLDENSLPREVWRGGAAGRVDWSGRDAEAFPAARRVVRELLTDPDGAKRVTVAAVGRRIGLETSLQKHPERFPRTSQYLKRAVQLQHRWEQRRLRLAVREFLAERTVPPTAALVARATRAKTHRQALWAMAELAVEEIRRTLGSG